MIDGLYNRDWHDGENILATRVSYCIQTISYNVRQNVPLLVYVLTDT